MGSRIFIFLFFFTKGTGPRESPLPHFRTGGSPLPSMRLSSAPSQDYDVHDLALTYCSVLTLEQSAPRPNPHIQPSNL